MIFTGVCGSDNLISSSFTGSLSNTDNSYIYNICSGSKMYFKPVIASASYPVGSVITYLWDFGNGLTSTLENPSTNYNLSSNTFFNVTLKITKNGVSSISTKNIFVNNCSPIVNSESTWYLNSKNILKFNTGVPRNSGIINFPGRGISNGQDFLDNTFNSINIQNDDYGNVIFFTDGKDIFNGSNPAIKINSDILISSAVDPQDTIILKSPLNITNQYYIIYKMRSNGSAFFPLSYGGLRYSIVNANNGLPTMNNSINIPIIPLTTQTGFRTSPIDGAFFGGGSLQIVEKKNGGYWIITSLLKTDGKLYLGIFDFSINGTIYLKNTFLLPSEYWDDDGTDFMAYNSFKRGDNISISPNGNKVFYRVPYLIPLILDFDKYEGLITQTSSFVNNFGINFPTFQGVFSSDSKLLYSNLSQMDINNPKININQIDSTKYFNSYLANDGKIYYLTNENSKVKIGVIHKPNSRITNSNPNTFLNQEDFLKPEFDISSDGFEFKFLPNFVQSKKTTAYNVNQISVYKVGCGSYKFFPDVPANSSTPVFTWNFGDPKSGVTNNISSLNTPIHVFSGSGTYTVSLTYNGSTTITTQIVITIFTAQAIQGTSSICYNSGNATTFNSVTLEDGQTVVWTRTSGTGTILQNNQSEVQINWTQLPGTITATITDSTGCVGTVTKTISLLPNVVPTFNVYPANICIGTTAPVLPTISNNGVTGVWSPPAVNNITSGNYTFNPNTNNCATPVNISITVLPANNPLCSGNTSCPPNLTLIAPETSTSTKNYKYKNWIKTMTNYSVASGKDINMKVEEYLVFSPNTHIMSGARMLGKIETCIVTSSRPISSVDNSKEFFSSDNIQVYPNPTTDLVNIYAVNSKITRILITSIEAKLIFEQKLNNETSFQFDLSNFTNGMYILTIETNEGKTFIKKLIKE